MAIFFTKTLNFKCALEADIRKDPEARYWALELPGRSFFLGGDLWQKSNNVRPSEAHSEDFSTGCIVNH